MRITDGSTSTRHAESVGGGGPPERVARHEPEPPVLRRIAARLGLERKQQAVRGALVRLGSVLTGRPPPEPEDVWDAKPIAGYPDAESLLHEKLSYGVEAGR